MTDYSTLTTDGLLRHSARREPGKTAVVASGISYTYDDLENSASRLGHLIASWGRISRVAVIMPNSFEWLVCCFAIAKAGAALVPLNPSYTDRELAYILDDAEVDAVFCQTSHAERLRGLQETIGTLKTIVRIDSVQALEELLAGVSDAPVVKRDWRQTQSILYTSGTTGQPKGAILSHRARIISGVACQLGLGFSETTRLNCPIPLFHSGGMALFTLTVIGAGGTLILPADASPAATAMSIREHGANTLAAVPTIISRLLDSAAFLDLASPLPLHISHGGSPMPIALAERMLSALPKCTPSQIYGTTEAPQLTIMSPAEYRRAPAATGRALPGTEVRVVDDEGRPVLPGEIGHVVTAGPHLFDGYLNAPEKTAKVLRDGYYWTGDLATIDERDLLSIVGRSTEVIISGGLNVYPKEIEDVVHSNAQVQQAAVFAVSDPNWGEIVGLAVVRKPQADLNEETLLEFCKQNLAPYKKPKRIWFVDEFPMTPAGKVRKFQLAERLVGSSSAPV